MAIPDNKDVVAQPLRIPMGRGAMKPRAKPGAVRLRVFKSKHYGALEQRNWFNGFRGEVSKNIPLSVSMKHSQLTTDAK